MLLSSDRHWCACTPPKGFAFAALVASSRLATSGRMLLLANSDRHFDDLNLRLVAAYLGHASQGAAARALDLRPRTEPLHELSQSQ